MAASVVFPVPGGTPEDHRRDLAGVDGPAQHPPGTDKLLLADVFVELPRSHPCRERPARGHHRVIVPTIPSFGESDEKRRGIRIRGATPRTKRHGRSIGLDRVRPRVRII